MVNFVWNNAESIFKYVMRPDGQNLHGRKCLSDVRLRGYLRFRQKHMRNKPEGYLYSHILWVLDKTPQLALDSIKQYLALYDNPTLSKKYHLPSADCLIQAVIIESRSGIKTHNAEILLQKMIQSKISTDEQASLIESIFHQVKQYKLKKYYKNRFPLWKLHQFYSKKKSIEGYMNAVTSLQLGQDLETLDISSKETKHPYLFKKINWNKHIAIAYEKQADLFDDPMHETGAVHNAILYYCKSRDKKSIENIKNLERYIYSRDTDLNYHVPMHELSHSATIPKKVWRQWLKNLKNIIHTNSDQQIIQSLSFEPFWLPIETDVRKEYNKISGEHPFLAMIPISTYNKFKFLINQAVTDKEIYEHRYREHYQLTLTHRYQSRIHPFIKEGINKGKISSNSFTAFANSTWFGREFPDTIKKLEVAVEEFIKQKRKMRKNKSKNFQLCIQSMSVLIEEIIRNLCDLLNGYHIRSRIKGNRLHTLWECDIKMMLNLSIVRMKLGDDFLFYDLLLIDHSSFNARHSVAHSFYTSEEYTEYLATLLFLAIIRLIR